MTSADQPMPSDAETDEFGAGAADAFPEGTPEGGAPEAQQADVTATGNPIPPSEERGRT